MTHALITGGAGFIGSHLAGYLLDNSYQVTVIDNLSTGRRENIHELETNPAFQFVLEDIRHTAVLEKHLAECDIVFHLAAAVGVRNILKNPIESIQINIGGTEAILNSAVKYNRQVLLASTSEVYGKGVRIPFVEEDDRLLGSTTKSRWSYAASKAIDEFMGLAYHQQLELPVTIFRLFNTVGERQVAHYGMVIPRFIQWALADQPIQVYGDGNQQRCFVNVHDAVDAIYRLSRSDEAIGQVFNIGSNEETSILELAQLVKERTGSASEIVLVPYDEAYTEPGYEDFQRRMPSIEKIKATVGWQPQISLAETIDQVAAYYRQMVV